ncbi:MAG: alpha/beta hydrolase [Acidobacteria bacterium]|nr:alpha/beta hydrolase [Acidobacteriota bacterium]
MCSPIRPLLFLLITLLLVACTHVRQPGEVNQGVAVSEDGTRIAYDVRGSGEPALVFVHCWACDREFWREQANEFADDYTVVTLDLAGHGDSGRGRSNWTVTGLAADVEAVVDDLDLDRVILIGHSMGGPVSLAAAARMPGRVEGIVAVDTLHNVEMEMPEEQQERIVGAFANDFDATVEQFVPMLTRNADQALVAWMTERAKAADRTAVVELMKDFMTVDEAALLRAAGAPIRAINAAPHPPILAPTAIEINRKYADFDAVLIDEVGHYIQLERPEEFNTKLREVLESLSR